MDGWRRRRLPSDTHGVAMTAFVYKYVYIHTGALLNSHPTDTQATSVVINIIIIVMLIIMMGFFLYEHLDQHNGTGQQQ